jgi:hypothetical protein
MNRVQQRVQQPERLSPSGCAELRPPASGNGRWRQIAHKVEDAGIPGQPAEQNAAGGNRVVRPVPLHGGRIQTGGMVLDVASRPGDRGPTKKTLLVATRVSPD